VQLMLAKPRWRGDLTAPAVVAPAAVLEAEELEAA
jgi:hypothetical protein